MSSDKLLPLYLTTIIVISLFSPAVTPVSGAVGNHTVSGTVTDAGNTGINGASVVVTDTTTGNEQASTTTEGSGSYSVTVPDGNYQFTFDASGYLPTSKTAAISSSVTIDATLNQAATISGVVTNETSGNPISGATVQIYNNSLGVFKTDTTDGSGQYSVDLQGGVYTVDVDTNNYVRNRSQDVGATIGSTTGQDISLSPAGTISGTITNESGGAIQTASITVTDGSGTYYTASSNQAGNYAVEVPQGSYTVKADNESYAPSSTSGISVSVNSTTTQDFTLNDAAIISGNVTDHGGSTVSGATISVWDSKFENFQQTTTNSQGHYQLEVANGSYTLEASASGYASTQINGVQATEGQTTSRDITFQPAATISGTVTDSQGYALSSAKIVLHDSGYATYETTQTNANGKYTIQIPKGNYSIRADKSGYARATDQVSVSVGETTTEDFQLGTPVVIEGTVTDSNGNPEPNVFVLVDDGSSYYSAQTDQNGDYIIEVPPGNYSVTASKDSIGAMGSGGTLEGVQSGNTYTLDIDLQNPKITNTKVKHIAGKQPNMGAISVNSRVLGGMMMVQLVDGQANGMPHDLSDNGVDRTTKFEITITVEDYDPNSLLWGVRDVNWTTNPNASKPQATDITIRTKAVNLQGIDGQKVGPVQDYESIAWPSGNSDKADLGWNNTVYFGLFDMSNVPSDIAGNVENMTIATNAQAFSRPQVTDDGLKVYVAGPHLRTNGVKHDGFYEAFIPNAQLDAWGVDDPAADLNALYKGDSSNFNVEETADGAWIKLDISYSDGTVEVEPDPSSSSSNGGSNTGNTGTGSGGSTYPSTQTPAPEKTPTPVNTPTITSTPTRTPGPVTAFGSTTESPDPTSTPTKSSAVVSQTSPEKSKQEESPQDLSTENPSGQPGFGFGLTLLAIIGILTLTSRRFREG